MPNDIRVASELFDFFVRKHGAAGDVEIVKRGLKTGPLGRDHTPDKARPKDAGRHFGQHIGITDRAQIRGVSDGCQQLLKRALAAFACRCSGINVVEVLHGFPINEGKLFQSGSM